MCHKTELVFQLHLFDTLTLIKCMELKKNDIGPKKWANIWNG